MAMNPQLYRDAAQAIIDRWDEMAAETVPTIAQLRENGCPQSSASRLQKVIEKAVAMKSTMLLEAVVNGVPVGTIAAAIKHGKLTTAQWKKALASLQPERELARLTAIATPDYRNRERYSR